MKTLNGCAAYGITFSYNLFVYKIANMLIDVTIYACYFFIILKCCWYSIMGFTTKVYKLKK